MTAMVNSRKVNGSAEPKNKSLVSFVGPGVRRVVKISREGKKLNPHLRRICHGLPEEVSETKVAEKRKRRFYLRGKKMRGVLDGEVIGVRGGISPSQ